jgi:hypothetical protein
MQVWRNSIESGFIAVKGDDRFTLFYTGALKKSAACIFQ